MFRNGNHFTAQYVASFILLSCFGDRNDVDFCDRFLPLVVPLGNFDLCVLCVKPQGLAAAPSISLFHQGVRRTLRSWSQWHPFLCFRRPRTCQVAATPVLPKKPPHQSGRISPRLGIKRRIRLFQHRAPSTASGDGRRWGCRTCETRKKGKTLAVTCAGLVCVRMFCRRACLRAVCAIHH